MSNELAVSSESNSAAVEKFLATGGNMPVGSRPAETRQTLAYVGFRGASAKSKLEELVAAGIGVNEFYLGDIAGLTRVKPFECHLLLSAIFGTHIDNSGAVDDIVPVVPKIGEPLYDDKYRKHIIGLVAVAVGDDLVLAQFAQRNSMVDGFERGRQLLTQPKGEALSAEGWRRRGALHAKTVDLPPMFRFRLRLWGSTVPLDGGNNMNQSHSQIVVTPESSFAAIKRLTGPEFKDVLEPAIKKAAERAIAWQNWASLDDDKKATTKLPF